MVIYLPAQAADDEPILDELTPREIAHQLYDNVGSKDKTLKIFTAAEGGAEHCQVDNRQVGTDYICDWLSARMNP